MILIYEMVTLCTYLGIIQYVTKSGYDLADYHIDLTEGNLRCDVIFCGVKRTKNNLDIEEQCTLKTWTLLNASQK